MSSSGVKIAKESLQKNYTRFTQELANPDEVAEYLFSDVDPPLLTENMKEEIKVERTPTLKTKKLLDKLSKRGERVPQKLYEALMETGNEELALCLVPYIYMHNKEKQKTAPSKWPPDNTEISQMLSTKIHHLKPKDPVVSSHFNKPDTYSMGGRRRGICLIINIMQYENKESDKFHLSARTGSKKDADNLGNVFRELHFLVQQKINLTAEEILSEVGSVAKNVQETDSCVVVAIFSHGGKDGIFGKDKIPVQFEEIKEKFYPVECPALNEKPKIFFIQACRGEQSETTGASGTSTTPDGRSGHQETTDSVVDHISDDIGEMTIADVNQESQAQIQGTLTVSRDSDFLIAYSTPEGAKSWRHQLVGSWFILAVVWVFRLHAHEMSLTDMLQKVNNYVSQGKAVTKDRLGYHVTVSNSTSSLRRHLYFFPGIYESNGFPREHPGTLE